MFWPGASAINWFHGAKTLRELSAQNYTIMALAPCKTIPEVRHTGMVWGWWMYAAIHQAQWRYYHFFHWLLHAFVQFWYLLWLCTSKHFVLNCLLKRKKWKNISAVAYWNSSKRPGTIGGGAPDNISERVLEINNSQSLQIKTKKSLLFCTSQPCLGLKIAERRKSRN